jgi:hypothetical protein
VVKELYPQERYRIGPDAGVFRSGSNFVVRVPGQTVTVFEVRPEEPRLPLVLGVSAKVERVERGRVELVDVEGERGQSAWLAVRGINEPVRELRVNGQPAPFALHRGLLWARVRFEGEPIDPELTWQAHRDGNRLFLKTRFYLPARARELLASHKYPLRADVRGNEKILRAHPWLDPSRLIIHLPLRNSDVFSTVSTVSESPGIAHAENRVTTLGATMGIGVARINGQEIPVERNLLKTRCAGLYIEPKDAVRFGDSNTLELAITGIHEGDVLPPYIQNLTPQYTNKLQALAAPEEWPFSPAPEAQDPFEPVPEVRVQGAQAEAELRLDFSSPAFQKWDGGVELEHGEALLVRTENISPGWGDAVDGRQQHWTVSTDKNTKSLRVHVRGSLYDRLKIRAGDVTASLSLGELLEPILRGSDPWNSQVWSQAVNGGMVKIHVLALPQEKWYPSVIEERDYKSGHK